MTKSEDKLEREAKTQYWCPKYVVPGKYNGLYVTHKPEEHKDWKKRHEVWRSCTKPKEKKDVDSKQKDQDSNKIALTDSFIAGLLTSCDLIGAQVDALLREVQEHLDC